MTTPNLQKAWLTLRHRHPQLAAVPNADGTRLIYTVPSEAALQNWVQETLIVDVDACGAEELYSTLKPSPAVKMYFVPKSRELVFRAPHWRIDAVGMMYLQNAFLDILGASQPDADADEEEVIFDGRETTRLAPSLDEVLNTTSTLRENSLNEEEIAQAVDAELDPLINNPTNRAAPLTLPTTGTAETLPTVPKRSGLTLSAEQSAALIATCKERGITVTTAAYASLLVTSARIQHTNSEEHTNEQTPTPKREGKYKYSAFYAVSLRKYLPHPFNGATRAVSLYHTGLPTPVVTLDENTSFASLAGILDKMNRRDLSAAEPRNVFSYLSECVGRITWLLLEGVRAQEEGDQGAHPELDSLGIVDRYLGRMHGSGEGNNGGVEVENWWMAVEIINRTLLLYIWTWEGRVHLGVNYNEAFYSPGFVDGFLEDWKHCLFAELDIA